MAATARGSDGSRPSRLAEGSSAPEVDGRPPPCDEDTEP